MFDGSERTRKLQLRALNSSSVQVLTGTTYTPILLDAFVQSTVMSSRPVSGTEKSLWPSSLASQESDPCATTLCVQGVRVVGGVQPGPVGLVVQGLSFVPQAPSVNAKAI